MESLVRLVYASHAVGVAPNAARSILASAQRNNRRLGVTGLLVVGTNHFLQVLEGGRIEVNALYRRILLDSRHRDPVLLYYAVTHLRFWSEWSMAYCSMHELAERATEYGFSAAHFDPLAIDSELVERLLLTVPVRNAID